MDIMEGLIITADTDVIITATAITGGNYAQGEILILLQQEFSQG
jgi:hypothetical protein